MAENSPFKTIVKRDGRIAPFDPNKILQAVDMAVRATGTEDTAIAEQVCREVVGLLEIFYKGNRVPNVEEIQDLVENRLIQAGYAEIAKRYILYRAQHDAMRSTKALLDDAVQMVDDYIGRADWRIKENSNMSFSLQGLNNHISSSISSFYWLNKIYPGEIGHLHTNGDFHIHDLGLLSVYCCGWDLSDVLTRGFRGAYGKVESAPAKHFRSALGQIVNFFYTMQGESAGAQAFANFDTLLAPFVAYDKLEYKQVKQSMQEFVFNMNIPTRVGFQTPFTNITMDLVCPKFYSGNSAIIGGEPTDRTYGEFQREMNMINKAFCEVMMEGDARGRIFTFPIPTYNITKEFDWDDPDLEPLWEMTSRYGIPYFSNFINSDMSPEDARSMCCRLRLDNRALRKRGGGLFGANPLTGSIGVVTVNLPRIGYEASDEEAWFGRIDYLMDRACESLETKRKILERLTDEGLYPYSKYYLSNIHERFGGFWNNHFSTIGLIGMNEALINFLGPDNDIASPEGLDLAQRTLTHMNERLLGYQDETGNLYNLEATPGEGTTYRLAKGDKKKYPDIFTQGDTDPYYTNSTHLPVDYTDDLFLALTHQDKLQTLYTGGTVLHGFIGERIERVETCKALVKKIAENFHMPYYTISPTFTICPEHGYLEGEHHNCPH
jgi:ribonucleoside-triphosphate reductase (formate)